MIRSAAVINSLFSINVLWELLIFFSDNVGEGLCWTMLQQSHKKDIGKRSGGDRIRFIDFEFERDKVESYMDCKFLESMTICWKEFMAWVLKSGGIPNNLYPTSAYCLIRDDQHNNSLIEFLEIRHFE